MERSFSPLRYWGGLYQDGQLKQFFFGVLVPFDIGVVYINIVRDEKDIVEF